MERQKHVTREQVIAAVERFLQRYGSRPIPVEALGEGIVTHALSQANVPGSGTPDEITHVERSEEGEIDLGAIMSSELDSVAARHGNDEPSSPAGAVGGDLASRSGSPASLGGSLQSPLEGARSGPSAGASVSNASSGWEAGPRPEPVAVNVRVGSDASPCSTTLVQPHERIMQSPPLNPALAPPDDVNPTRWGRYPIDGELARGGQGRILNAFDDIIGRPVALKILRKDGLTDTRLVRRFYEEAQVTGQLEHPNIVPVHELGWLENGLPYYTMKKVEGRTLKKVIIGLRKGNPQVQAQFGRIKLIHILQQVCQAISYAHDRGVIHRDLKPANIMLGDYGEVAVLDWGVAKVRSLKEPVQADNLRPVRIFRHSSAMDTQAGTVEGTPAYMSPEQARGRIHEIDERSDVYALGAILYEILAYRPPFRGQDVREVLRQVVEEMPPRPTQVAPQNLTPEELENICMKCLAKSPADRYASVKELQTELEDYLEGTKRRAAAALKVEEARELVKAHLDLKRELLMARLVARRAAEGIQGWEPIERKRGVWATRSRVQEIEAKVVTTFGEAVARYSQALAHDPENTEAQEGLADLFMAQLKQAEEQGDHSEAVYSESMLRQYHNGKYAQFLKGDGFLSIDTDPGRAEVWLYRYEERDRILRPMDAQRLGIAPVTDVRLPRGSYLVVLRAPGVRDVYYPVRIGRQEGWRARVKMYTHQQIGDGFVYVPGGPVILGGDHDAVESCELETKTVPDFAIQEFPVTFREYVEFLNAWLAVDPNEAQRFIPVFGDTPLVVMGPSGFLPSRDLIGPEGRALARPGMEGDVPVFGIDFEMAESYCAWRTEISGREYRLLREEEWEKAARGVDGRAFPWGNQFDPTFCKSRLSRPWAPEPEPIGSFPEDTSPYGVRDMAGGVREWVDGWFNEAQGLRVLRGGAWVDTERYVRCANRSFYDPYLSKRINGFRCARSLR